MPTRPDPTAKAREAFRLASDLMMDLIGGMQAHRTFELLFVGNPAPEPVSTQVNRLCLFHIIITLSKWNELYDRYLDVFPEDTRHAAKALMKQIEQKGIVEFRNKVAGHIWDSDSGRALTNAEVEQRLSTITGPDLTTFMRWVNNPDDSRFPQTAASVIERVRDRVREVYGFTDADLLG